MSYDVAIVGGGAAGCLIAGRLATETNARVLLLEAGGTDWNPLIHIPAGFSKLLAHNQFVWPYKTVPQPSWTAGGFRSSRARGWAAAARSTRCAWCEATPLISTTGTRRSAVRAAGPTMRCCPTSARWRRTTCWPMAIMAATARSTSRSRCGSTRSISRRSRRSSRRGCPTTRL